jgi:hypothetical protein
VEDMTYGLPVLPSGILANRDALCNDFAIAYFDNSAEALASVILALYENPEMRLAMGKYNLQRVRQRHVFNAAGIWPFQSETACFLIPNQFLRRPRPRLQWKARRGWRAEPVGGRRRR